MQEPKVGVIVPVYNVEKYLSECLDSLLNQEYRNYVILAVNDGSTDACPQILEHYQENHPNLFVFSKPNGGVSSAKNVALEKLQSLNCEYVCFVDSDDKVSPTFIRDFIEHFQTYNVNYGACGVALFDRNGEYAQSKKVNTSSLPTHSDIISHYFGVNQWIKRDQTTYRFLVNRCFAFSYIKNLSFDETLITSEDQKFFFDASENIESGILIPKTNYFYRQRKSSLSHNHLKRLDELNFYLNLLKTKKYRSDTHRCIVDTAINCWWIAVNSPEVQKDSNNWFLLDQSYHFLKTQTFSSNKKSLKRFWLYKFLKLFFKKSLLKKANLTNNFESFYE